MPGAQERLRLVADLFGDDGGPDGGARLLRPGQLAAQPARAVVAAEVGAQLRRRVALFVAEDHADLAPHELRKQHAGHGDGGVLEQQQRHLVEEHAPRLLRADDEVPHLIVQLGAAGDDDRAPAHSSSSRFIEAAANRPEADWSMMRTSS